MSNNSFTQLCQVIALDSVVWHIFSGTVSKIYNKARHFFIFRLSRNPTVFFQEMENKLKFRFFIAHRMKSVPNLKKNETN